ncbi:MAG: His-Xaa-Ser system protein HxsD [Candidatus Diapherotrites archaeon]
MEHVKLFPKHGKAIVSVNPKVFTLEVVYSAAYVLLDKAYFFLDGDPAKEILVTIKARDKKRGAKALEEIANHFNNELINYSVYAVQAARNQAIREAIIQRALATNLSSEQTIENPLEPVLEEKAKKIRMPENEDEDLYLKDPEGIAEPWTPKKAKGLKKPKV